MTTNSPNPVDGDVQVHQMPVLTQAERKTAIDSCVAEISHLERCIKAYPDQPVLRVDLLVQKVALAALTAEPVYQFIANDPDKDGYIEWADCNPDYFSKEPTDMRRILYTTPPAQLLRPVELPDCVDDLHGVGPVMSADAVIEALRQQGYEVKND